MKQLSKINFLDIFFAIVFSLLSSVFIYKLLYPLWGYSNLNDFFVGITVYDNHNKILDILIYFIFLTLSFAFMPLFYCIRSYLPDLSIYKRKLTDKAFKIIDIFTNKIKIPEKYILFLKKYQYIALAAFLLLYPFCGHIYIPVALIVVLIIFIAAFDIYKRNKCENKTFSPWAIAAILFLFFFKNYSLFSVYIPDDHHLGETIATFFEHSKFHLEYFKDIMLMHGYTDILPSLLGKIFFNEEIIYDSVICSNFLQNIFFIFITVGLLYIYKEAPVFIAPILFINYSISHIYYICIYFIIYLLLLRFWKIEKTQLWCCLYIGLCFILFLNWTSFGGFWILASMPFAIWMFSKLKNKKNTIFLIILVFAIFFILNKNYILHFIKYFLIYSNGNAAAFGDGYGKIIDSFVPFAAFIIKTFALIAIPYFVIEILKEIQKNEKNYKYIYFLLFSVIIVLASTPYSLTRIGYSLMERCEFISVGFLAIILPFMLYIKYPEYRKNILTLFFSLLLFLGLLIKIPYLMNNFNKIVFKPYSINPLNKEQIRLNYIKEFLTANMNSNDLYYDLTNRGKNYLYLNQKLPVQFISYYNSINTIQDMTSLESLKKNPPKIILIMSNTFYPDNVPVSLRINAQYKWMLNSGMYKPVVYGGSLFLFRDDSNIIPFYDEFYEILDNALSQKPLDFLPEAWANSINTLPISEVEINYSIKKNSEKEYKIEFEKPIQGRNIDLLYIASDKTKNNLITGYLIKINSSKSKIECRSKNGKILIPFDNFPSWMLSNNILEITVNTDKDIEKPKIKFYKRNNQK